MSPSPFEHGLALAWSDGALSRRGAQLLELLQTRFGLNDDSRADIEEIWQESLVNLNRRSFGDGDENLSSWLEALKDTGDLEKGAKDLGRTSLEIGLSRSIWSEAYSFAKGLDLGDAFAAGAWMEESAEAVNTWPEALDPLALIIGKGLSELVTRQRGNLEFSIGTPVIILPESDSKTPPLAWLPGLLPMKDGCAWGWSDDRLLEGNSPEGDLLISTSVLQAWVRRLITQRIERGDTPLPGLPSDSTLMTSSTSVNHGEKGLNLEIIVDLGEKGLVKPWAGIEVADGSIKIRPAPSGLAASWISLHDGLAELLVNSIETLPRQLLTAVNSELSPSATRLEDGWVVIDLS
ncbi:MAG: hypothetical protein ACKVJ7_01485 [Candidatus Poseidoniales archaeon]